MIIESDAEIVVNMWKAAAYERSEIVAILHDIQELRANFEYFNIVFATRDAIILAHLCAKQAIANRRRCLWINYSPNFLVDCILHDCNPAC